MRIHHRRGVVVLCIAVALVAAGAGCSEDDPPIEVGGCVAVDDGGVRGVDCASDDADKRLVKEAGSTVDPTDPDCPEGSEAFGIAQSGESIGSRWCAEDV